MPPIKTTFGNSLALCALLVGCGTGVAKTGASLSVPNGVRLNGVRLNGVRLNGVRLNGVRLNGVRLNGTRLGAIDANRAPIEDVALVGALLEGQMQDGSALSIPVDGASVLPGDDIVRYQLSANFGGTWAPLCESGPDGQPLGATFAAGLWNQEQGVPVAARGRRAPINSPWPVKIARSSSASMRATNRGSSGRRASRRTFKRACG